MNFFQAIASFFRNYAVFKGRSSRSEFWWVVLFSFLVGVALAPLDVILFSDFYPVGVVWGYGLLSDLYFLGTIVPWLAVGARRLHDINRSGWWQLIWEFFFVTYFLVHLAYSGLETIDDSSNLATVLFIIILGQLLVFLILWIASFILFLYWFCKKGNEGDNRFGSNPLAKSVDTAAS